jgi:glycosyltransferase involved in cell wall biosynthesis
MNILFLSHYFPPEVNAPATRTFEHCKEWVRQGHQVTVVSCVPHHPMGKAYSGYSNKWIHVEYTNGIKAIKVLTYITANEGFLKRTVNYIIYMLMAILLAPFLSRADVVISTSPQFFNGLAGYFVSRIKRAPWVLEIRDLWPESIVAVGAIKNRRLINVLESIERFVYRKADHVVAVTYAFKDHIRKVGGRKIDVLVLRNGVDLNAFNDTPIDRELEKQWGLHNKFVAAYVGTHGMAHGLETILDAAEILKDNQKIIFLLVGDGADKAHLINESQRRGLRNVILKEQQPKHKMPLIWAMTDVSLVLLKKLDLFKTVIPSKIFESMAMQKPIILGVEGEARSIVEESGAGMCIEPESAVSLAGAVLELSEKKQHYEQLSLAGRKYVEKKFNRVEIAERYLNLLSDVVA